MNANESATDRSIADAGAIDDPRPAVSYEHEPVFDVVPVDGQPVELDRCQRCGQWSPAGPCRGPNYTLDSFDVDRTASAEGAD